MTVPEGQLHALVIAWVAESVHTSVESVTVPLEVPWRHVWAVEGAWTQPVPSAPQQ